MSLLAPSSGSTPASPCHRSTLAMAAASGQMTWQPKECSRVCRVIATHAKSHRPSRLCPWGRGASLLHRAGVLGISDFTLLKSEAITIALVLCGGDPWR